MRLLVRLLVAVSLLVALVWVGLSTPFGFRLIEVGARMAGVAITGLAGRFPAALVAGRITLADAGGIWLTIEDAAIDWAPQDLLDGRVSILRLAARRVAIARVPVSEGGSGGVSLPPVSVARIELPRIELPGLLLAVSGAGQVAPGIIVIQGQLHAEDAAGQGPADLDLAVVGPPAALVTTARLRAAGLDLAVDGTVNAEAPSALLHLVTDHPAMAGVSATRIEADLTADPVRQTLDATITGPVLPGDRATLLGDRITLSARLAGGHADVTARTTLLGEPAVLDAGAVRGAGGVVHVAASGRFLLGISAQAALAWTLTDGLPTGRVLVDVPRLPPPARAGRISTALEMMRQDGLWRAQITSEVDDLALTGATLRHAVLTAGITDPLGAAQCEALLVADGLAASGFREDVRLELNGDPASLAWRLSGQGDAALRAEGSLDVAAARLRIAALQATSALLPGQPLRLVAPASLTVSPDMVLDKMRLALGGSTLEVGGRLAPVLDASASLRLALADLAALGITAQGNVTAEARLGGSLAAPRGTVRLTATGVASPDAALLPQAGLDAEAEFDATAARISATARAGAAHLAVTGRVPLVGGVYDLRVTGGAELAMLDRLLAPAGRQARGTVTLDGTLTGTLTGSTGPTPSGALILRGGMVSDAGLGMRLTDVDGLVRAEAGLVILQRLSARLGGGTVSAHGTLGLAAPMPVSGQMSVVGATIASADVLTARLGAELALSGDLTAGLAASGRVRLARADITIPERLPASLPNLAFRKPPGAAPLPPAMQLPVSLDLRLDAPGSVFVHGRGVDAELAGSLRLGGTAADPRPAGGFTLRRGQFALAGQTLTFTTGKVAFDGHLPIDPTLDLVATSQGTGVLATLTVAGTASRPHIALSSVPDLPQDEVLAQLLFRRSAASLTPLQLAQIAAGLAQVADLGGSGGIDPLGAIRRRLGLDVLTVGGGTETQAGKVEAGVNVAKGVYLGARQSTGGTGSQATVRIDLSKGLRLEADVGVPPPPGSPVAGAPPTGNQIGLVYEFEY
jgi:translocation and assembly module TamB